MKSWIHERGNIPETIAFEHAQVFVNPEVGDTVLFPDGTSGLVDKVECHIGGEVVWVTKFSDVAESFVPDKDAPNTWHWVADDGTD